MEATESSRPLRPQQGVDVEVDWSDLPADLLETICKMLHDLFDFIYFRAVFKKWRAATQVSDLPTQVPWLFQPAVGCLSGDLCFYSIISGKTRTIHCPQSRGKVLRGPSHGYLYASNSCRQPRHSLLNPFTKHEVIIESPTSAHSMIGMGPDPIGGDVHIAFMDYTFPRGLGFYQLHSRQRKTVEWPENVYIEMGFCNACLRGMYFMDQTPTRNTVVVDILRHSSFSLPFLF